MSLLVGETTIADGRVTGEDIAEEILWCCSRAPHIQIAQMREQWRIVEQAERSHLPDCPSIRDDQLQASQGIDNEYKHRAATMHAM